jgi:hypothetical protein
MTNRHPPQPETESAEDEPAAPNTSQLPIEPEFGPLPPPQEPEDPGADPPKL